MAEIILAALVILIGLLAIVGAAISMGANHFGGPTAPDRVDHKGTFICLAIAVLGIGGGIWMLLA